MQPRSLGLLPGRDGTVFHVTKSGLPNEGRNIKRSSQHASQGDGLVQSRILKWRLDVLLIAQPST
jgi:hypothetical protein